MFDNNVRLSSIFDQIIHKTLILNSNVWSHIINSVTREYTSQAAFLI